MHHWFERCARLGLPEEPVVPFDKLTYAGNPHTIGEHLQAGRATLVQADIGDREALLDACWPSTSPAPSSTSLPKAM